LIPFDGIEFNDQFRWIDVLSDAGFAAMDFAARDHLELSRIFINAYLEQTGDHASPSLLRWYLVFRAMVRAKVAGIRATQDESECTESMRACRDHIDLAYSFSLRQDPYLWITHGVSGSGKTTASEGIVRRFGAIRLRSDFERKRHFGISPSARLSERAKRKIYSESANHATYSRLRRLATGILRAGYPVIIDATFLKRDDRDRFHDLAIQEGATFAILNCRSDEATLRQRISKRLQRDDDASEANVQVMQQQLTAVEPLTKSELAYVVDADNKY
jgi:predicted kinase